MIEQYLASGLSVIPVGNDKRPLVKWSEYQTRLATLDELKPYNQSWALVCGPVSGGLEVIDVDCRTDEDRKVYSEYKHLIKEQDPNLLRSLVAQQTQNGGYHLIYRCPVVEGNKKLAQKADRTVLIETRGAGGYFLVHPSPGYKVIWGKITEIPTITEEQRKILHDSARALTQYKEVEPTYKADPLALGTDDNPFEDFHRRGDSLGLLLQHGWTTVYDKADKVLLRRPGKNVSWSASFDRTRNILYVHTSSTEFPPGKGYNGGHIYTYLEAGGDFSRAAKQLVDLGYGKRRQHDPVFTEKSYERVRVEDADYSFLLSDEAGVDYLTDAAEGSLTQGLKWGWPTLDTHLAFKYNQYLLIVGNTNVGKTTLILAMLVSLIQTNEKEDLKFLCLITENTVGNFKRVIAQYYLRKPFKKGFISAEEVRRANEFISHHFKFIDTSRGYHFVDAVSIGTKMNKVWPYHAFFIDPYSGLDVDMRLMPGGNPYEYHVRASREFQRFAVNETGLILNAHTVTSQQRLGSDSTPLISTVEGGGAFVNKAHDAIVLHRNLKDPNRYRVSEIHVDKIKDIYTGGMWTMRDKPVELRLNEDGTAFIDDKGATMITDPSTSVHTMSNDDFTEVFGKSKKSLF